MVHKILVLDCFFKGKNWINNMEVLIEDLVGKLKFYIE